MKQVRMTRGSPTPTLEDYDPELAGLEMGAGEADVEEYFQREVLFKSRDGVRRVDKIPMNKHVVPHNPMSSVRISQPAPDSLYGYVRKDAFAQQQKHQLLEMGNEMVANSAGLLYPFFAIEFKSDGPSKSGSLWVATNQCLGSSSSCVSIAETLNSRLQQCKSKEVYQIDSASFSIAMSGTEARLYISWKQGDLDYYTKKVESYLLQRPADFLMFRQHVLNIIDWGRNERLEKIRNALDQLLEASRSMRSQEVKSRQPSLSDNVESRNKRVKATNDPVWIWEPKARRYYYQTTDGRYVWEGE
ncbi:MAG: hypothetical protein Q9166_002881 [cf. Caloplaca sp. 2 TL-2023]